MAADRPPIEGPEPGDAWTSPLWQDPDTVGGHWPAPAELPPSAAPVTPTPPPATSRRGLVAVAIAVVLALVLGSGAAYALLRPGSPSAAAKPPAAPSTPVAPTAPSAPAPQPSSGVRGGHLTPDERATAAAVAPGLVDIVSTIGYQGQRGAGTGIVLTSDGLVLTNHHVVAGSTALKVTSVGTGKTYSATVLGYDSTHDVAVLKLAGASSLPVAPLGDSATVRVGDQVVALGNAGGRGGAPHAVAGPVTALDERINVTDPVTGEQSELSGLIEARAAIRPGDSGGAMVDAGAKVVGMTTAASVGSGASNTSASTLGYAVPIAQAKQIADEIIAGRSSDTIHVGETAFLGVQLSDLEQLGVDGVLIAGAVEGSAAERAGIREGDVITAIDGQAVHSAAQLKSAIAGHGAGDTVSITWRTPDGTSHTKSLTLGSGPVG